MDDVKKLTPEETVAALRYCVNDLPCTECVMYPYMIDNCTMKLCATAADTIEELLAQTPLALIVPDVDLSEDRLAMFREEMRTAIIMPDGPEPSIEFVQQGWIPVTERLPEDGRYVLTIVSGHCGNVHLDRAVELAEFSTDEGWILEMWPELEDPNITYWMPIPKVPEV